MRLESITLKLDPENQKRLAKKWVNRYRHYAFQKRYNQLTPTVIPIFISPKIGKLNSKQIKYITDEEHHCRDVFALSCVAVIVPEEDGSGQITNRVVELESPQFAGESRSNVPGYLQFVDRMIYRSHQIGVERYFLEDSQCQVTWKDEM